MPPESSIDQPLGTDRRGRLPADSAIGTNITLGRQQFGWTQERLGAAIGVSFQQVQKYEIGKNRVAASRLYAIAKCFDVPMEYFFKETVT